jgi:hypothetical protein
MALAEAIDENESVNHFLFSSGIGCVSLRLSSLLLRCALRKWQSAKKERKLGTLTT